ncbi:MAG: YgiT-type zinc finger protein [Asgard group archaeon]
MQKAKIKMNYGGTIVETEGYRCPKCGEEFLTIEQAKKSRRKLAPIKATRTRAERKLAAN